MSRLSESQFKFTQMVADLIVFAYDAGYTLTFGEAYRTPEQAKLNAQSGAGITNSLHGDRLAIDLNLFKNGQYFGDSVSHKPLGEYWKGLDENNAWGGDFKERPDGNHYSYCIDGRK